jgi:hypothetical protein
MDNPQQDRGADDGLPGIAVAKQAQLGVSVKKLSAEKTITR